MKTLFPDKLSKGDTIRVVTPARSLAMPWIGDITQVAKARLEEMGFNVTFGLHVKEINEFNSSSIKSRIEDLHEAFANPEVKMVHTVIGGFNSIELLPELDYELIQNNPKVLCGYSDITALANAIYARTGLVTYSGPHFFDFGEKKGFEYTQEAFIKCLCSEQSFTILPSEEWSNDKWGKDQEKRNFNINHGHIVIQEGSAEGKLLGGNLVTFHALSGTQYFPSLEGSVLFLEEDDDETIYSFNRNLVSLSLRPDFKGVKGILFGRFQPGSSITIDILRNLIQCNPRLRNLPIIAGLDFGHTTPRLTLPIGGKVCFTASNSTSEITVLQH